VRTEDEHLLLNKDLQFTREYFNKDDVAYFNLVTFLFLIFIKNSLLKVIYQITSVIEELFFILLSFVQKYSRAAVIEIEK